MSVSYYLDATNPLPFHEVYRSTGKSIDPIQNLLNARDPETGQLLLVKALLETRQTGFERGFVEDFHVERNTTKSEFKEGKYKVEQFAETRGVHYVELPSRPNNSFTVRTLFAHTHPRPWGGLSIPLKPTLPDDITDMVAERLGRSDQFFKYIYPTLNILLTFTESATKKGENPELLFHILLLQNSFTDFLIQPAALRVNLQSPMWVLPNIGLDLKNLNELLSIFHQQHFAASYATALYSNNQISQFKIKRKSKIPFDGNIYSNRRLLKPRG